MDHTQEKWLNEHFRHYDGQPKRKLSLVQAKHEAERNGMEYYRCSLCGYYHTGHISNSRKMQIQEANHVEALEKKNQEIEELQSKIKELEKENAQVKKLSEKRQVEIEKLRGQHHVLCGAGYVSLRDSYRRKVKVLEKEIELQKNSINSLCAQLNKLEKGETN